jgi:hypothetical protein
VIIAPIYTVQSASQTNVKRKEPLNVSENVVPKPKIALSHLKKSFQSLIT